MFGYFIDIFLAYNIHINYFYPYIKHKINFVIIFNVNIRFIVFIICIYYKYYINTFYLNLEKIATARSKNKSQKLAHVKFRFFFLRELTFIL